MDIKNIVLILIYLNIFNNSSIKNKKINVNIKDDKKSLYLKFFATNEKSFEIKILENFGSYNKNYDNAINNNNFYLSRAILDCDDTKIKCIDVNNYDNFNNYNNCIYGKSKKIYLKFFQDQKEFYEFQFCYMKTIDDNYNDNYKKTKNSIKFNYLLDILGKNLKNFDLKYNINFGRNKLNEQIYLKANIIINPNIPKNKSQIDIFNTFLLLKTENVNPNFKIFGNFSSMFFNFNIFDDYDFKIYTSVPELLNLDKEIDINKNLKGNMIIKSNVDNEFKTYNIELNKISNLNHRKILIEENDKHEVIDIGLSYLNKYYHIISNFKNEKFFYNRIYRKNYLNSISNTNKKPTQKSTKNPNQRTTNNSNKNPTQKSTKNPNQRTTNNSNKNPTQKSTKNPNQRTTNNSNKNPTQRSTKNPNQRTTNNSNKNPTQRSINNSNKNLTRRSSKNSNNSSPIKTKPLSKPKKESNTLLIFILILNIIIILFFIYKFIRRIKRKKFKNKFKKIKKDNGNIDKRLDNLEKIIKDLNNNDDKLKFETEDNIKL